MRINRIDVIAAHKRTQSPAIAKANATRYPRPDFVTILINAPGAKTVSTKKDVLTKIPYRVKAKIANGGMTWI